jgi:hypothetical protein
MSAHEAIVNQEAQGSAPNMKTSFRWSPLLVRQTLYLKKQASQSLKNF